MAVEVEFQQLQNDIMQWRRLNKLHKLKLEDFDAQDLKEILEQAGIVAEHIKRAYGVIKGTGLPPASVSLQIADISLTWHL